MEERLQWIRLQPQRWLDWLPLTGGLETHAVIQMRYPQATDAFYEANAQRRELVRQYFKPSTWWGRWQQVIWRALNSNRFRAGPEFWQAEADPASFDMVWANMSLHLSPQPQQWLDEWCKALRPDGFLMFSCCGPDTLIELRHAYAEQGWNPPTHDFTDMHDWGDMLVHAGFAEPVMDMEKITVTYRQAQDLWRDLRMIGRNLHVQRTPGLRGRAWLQRFEAMFEALRVKQGGDTVQMTFEIIYGHAIKPVPKMTVASTTTVSLRDMKTMLQR